jgi:enterochelin esterase-like enzyme
MGGFGALRLGIKYSNRFEAVSAHSSITDLQQMELFVEEPLTDYIQEEERENSVWGMAQKNNGPIPKLRFDCGTDDLLIEHNRELHQKLLKAHINHEYQEFPGGHEWPYWQEHLKNTLLFFGDTI